MREARDGTPVSLHVSLCSALVHDLQLEEERAATAAFRALRRQLRGVAQAEARASRQSSTYAPPGATSGGATAAADTATSAPFVDALTGGNAGRASKGAVDTRGGPVPPAVLSDLSRALTVGVPGSSAVRVEGGGLRAVLARRRAAVLRRQDELHSLLGTVPLNVADPEQVGGWSASPTFQHLSQSQ